MKNKKNSDIIVIGGGIVGLSIARSLGIRYPSKSIKLLEKDSLLGRHNSILNSGVIHAGLYYPTNSNRANYCVRGNKLLTNYHKDNNINIRHTGKIIMATNKSNRERFDKLYRQGLTNGVNLKLISPSEAIKIEPYLKITNDGYLIYTQDTKVGSPNKVIDQLEKDIKSLDNVEILINTGFKSVIKNSSREIVIEDLNGFKHESSFIINASGLHSDKIAKQFNIASEYKLMPILGTYLIDAFNTNKMNTLIYPVPPVQATKGSNFLGVHTTLTIDGQIKLGPTAVPGFWREYHLGLKSFDLKEFYDVIRLYFDILLSDKRNYYMNLFIHQLQNKIPSKIVDQAKELVTIYDKLDKNYFGLNKTKGKFKYKAGGVRSQLINVNNFEMENDFIILKTENQIHLLNMISPGWTCALAIAEDIILN